MASRLMTAAPPNCRLKTDSCMPSLPLPSTTSPITHQRHACRRFEVQWRRVATSDAAKADATGLVWNFVSRPCTTMSATKHLLSPGTT